MLIAICDDEQRELEAIDAALTAAALELSADIEIAAYPSGAALVEAVEGGVRPALAVLNIYMGEENGVKTAGVLCGLIPGLPCAFLTTSRDFAVEAFSLDALHYIMKPVTVEKLKELLERFFTHVERPPRCLALPDQQGERQVPLEQICYLLGQDRGIEIHLQTGREWFPCLFRQAAEQLVDEADFVQISRSCFVNLNEVLHLGNANCHLKNGEALPISRRERQTVQTRYNDFAFRRMNWAKEAGL